MTLPAWIALTTKRSKVRALPAIWRLYITSYAQIGLTIKNPHALLAEYDLWEVYVDTARQIRAFRLAKRTPYGVKAGLSGTDGSAEARQIFRTYIAAWFRTPGHYGEVSHKMETLAFRQDAPVVCAIDAAIILRKAVHFEPDGIHYTRPLVNIGPVTKVMVGRPRETPVTSATNPACPRPEGNLGARRRAGRAVGIDASLDAELAHLTCLLDL